MLTLLHTEGIRRVPVCEQRELNMQLLWKVSHGLEP